MYITHEEYIKKGGTVTDKAAFPMLERKARYKLDFYTQDRIRALAEIPESVKDCMAEIIDMLPGKGEKVSSFSNDGVSVSFEQSDDEKCIYDLIVQVLPQELVYLGAD